MIYPSILDDLETKVPPITLMKLKLLPEGLLCGTRLNFDVRPSVRPVFFRFSARRKALKTRFLDQSVQAKTSNSENPKNQNDVSEVGIGTYFRFFYETFLKKFPGYVSMKISDLFQLGSYLQCKIKTNSHFQHKNTSTTSD